MNFPKYLYGLDIFRGFASLAVVLWHWQHFFMIDYKLPSNFDRSCQPLYTLFRPMYEYGYIAVPFFFQLSGFVFFWLYRERITSGACSAYKFALLRFARLYPLHILTLLVVLFLQLVHKKIIGGYFVYPENDSYHFALHTLFMSNWGFERGYSFNAPAWSVSIEIGLYFLFFLYCLIRIPNAVKISIVLLGAALSMRFGLGAGNWIPAIFAFFLGGLLYSLVDIYLSYRSKFWDNVIVCLGIAAWVSVMISERASNLLLTQSYNSLLFLFPITIASSVLVETKFPKVAKKFAWLGNITYSSYLLHFPLQLFCALAVLLLGYDKEVFYSGIVLVLFMLSLITLSLLTYHNFERPLQNYLTKGAYRS